MALSNFKETKQVLETLFTSNWSMTPVHYSGASFDSTDLDEWINVVYQPLAGYVTGVSGNSTTSRGNLHVVCWAKNEYDANVKADQVVEIFYPNLPKDIVCTKYEMSDQGFNSSGKAFVMITFPIKSFIVAC